MHIYSVIEQWLVSLSINSEFDSQWVPQFQISTSKISRLPCSYVILFLMFFSKFGKIYECYLCIVVPEDKSCINNNDWKRWHYRNSTTGFIGVLSGEI